MIEKKTPRPRKPQPQFRSLHSTMKGYHPLTDEEKMRRVKLWLRLKRDGQPSSYIEKKAGASYRVKAWAKELGISLEEFARP